MVSVANDLLYAARMATVFVLYLAAGAFVVAAFLLLPQLFPPAWHITVVAVELVGVLWLTAFLLVLAANREEVKRG